MARRYESKEEAQRARTVGHGESMTVTAYLKALNDEGGTIRRRDPEKVQREIDRINAALVQAQHQGKYVRALELIRQRYKLEGHATDVKSNLAKLEEEFIKIAPSFSERKRITYVMWREVGVPASVLKQAGISP